MRLLEAMEPESGVFLYELYTLSGGDARHGVPYEALIDALELDEALIKRLQGALQRGGWVDLTTVPPVTHVGRPVMGTAHRHGREQTIGLTLQGQRLVEDSLALRRSAASRPSSSADRTTTI
jgi:hypothetical protein